MNKVREYIKQQETKTVGINEIAAELNLKKREVIEDLRDILQDIMHKNPDGLTITDLTSMMKINRNWIAKQLDLLFLSGKVQRKRIGPAKIYTLSEDGLTKWEKYYLALLENASDLIMVINDKGNSNFTVDFVSQSVKRILGYTPKEMEELNLLDLIHPEERSRLEDYSELFDNGESEHTLYIRCLSKNNEWRHLEVVVTDLTNDKNVEGLVINCKDITETVQLEEKIQFRVIFEKFILRLSTKFIDIPFDKLDQIIANGIGSIGKFFAQNTLVDFTVSPSQINLYLFSDKNKKMICSHQWITQVASTVLTSVIWEQPNYNEILSLFEDKDLIYYPDVEAVIEKLKITFNTIFSEKLTAFIMIPLYDSEENPLGFIIFQFLESHTKWTDDAIEMLDIIGTILQSALRNLSRNIEGDLFQYFASRRKK